MEQEKVQSPEERLAADAARLAEHAVAVDAAVKAWRERKDNHDAEAISGPAVALLKNRSNTEMWGRAVSAAGLDVALLTAFVDAAQAVNVALAVRLDYADAVEATTLAEDIRPAIASKYSGWSDKVREQARAALAAYDAAAASYKTALQEQANRDNPPSTRQTGRGRGGRGGSRGTPEWEQNHGWRFVADCDNCHNVITSGAGTGSFQNDVKNHWPKCRGFNLDSNGIYAGDDRDPRFAEAHKGLTEAMYRLVDGADTSEGGGFHMHREYTRPAPVAAA